MRRHVKRWLNDAALRSLGGRYEGVIAEVIEERVRNKFKRDESGKPVERLEPVVVFEDGWRLVPNFGMREALVAALGHDSDAWIGRRIAVFREAIAGATTTRWEKRCEVPDADEVAPF